MLEICLFAPQILGRVHVDHLALSCGTIGSLHSLLERFVRHIAAVAAQHAAARQVDGVAAASAAASRRLASCRASAASDKHTSETDAASAEPQPAAAGAEQAVPGGSVLGEAVLYPYMAHFCIVLAAVFVVPWEIRFFF